MSMFSSTTQAVELALAFADAFPISDPENPTLVTVHALDKFAEDHDEYSLAGEQALIVARRYGMRQKINRVARGSLWLTLSDKPAFQIAVRNRGRDYLVRATGEAFEHDATILPSQVGSFLNTKRKNLKNLRKSTDATTLPPSLQLGISLLDRSIDDLSATVQFHVDRINADLLTIQREVAKFVASDKKRLPRPEGDGDDRPDDRPRLM